jgi:hypothetical protein
MKPIQTITQYIKKNQVEKNNSIANWEIYKKQLINRYVIVRNITGRSDCIKVHDTQAPSGYKEMTFSDLKTKIFKNGFEHIQGRDGSSAHIEQLKKELQVVNGDMFKPDKGLIFKINNDDYLNSYQPPSNKLRKPSDDELKIIEGYFESVFPVERERLSICGWLNYIATNPHKKTEVSLLLHGMDQGTGKSTLVRIATKLVGESQSRSTDKGKDFLSNRFNASLEGLLLLGLEEIYSKSDKCVFWRS